MEKPAVVYDAFRQFIDGHRNELDIPDYLIEDLKAAAIAQDGFEANKGYLFERTECNPLEKAFYEAWLLENRPHTWINQGHGTLQNLFIESKGNSVFAGTKWHVFINDRDRYIVATVIQWLGTNCGQGFLNNALKQCGLAIVKK